MDLDEFALYRRDSRCALSCFCDYDEQFLKGTKLLAANGEKLRVFSF